MKLSPSSITAARVPLSMKPESQAPQLRSFVADTRTLALCSNVNHGDVMNAKHDGGMREKYRAYYVTFPYLHSIGCDSNQFSR